jgi:hypothetical protein
LTDNSSGGNILSPMEQEPTGLEKRIKSIKRKGGTPTLVDGKLVVEWPAQTSNNTATVGLNNVASGTGKRIAYPRGG